MNCLALANSSGNRIETKNDQPVQLENCNHLTSNLEKLRGDIHNISQYTIETKL